MKLEQGDIDLIRKVLIEYNDDHAYVWDRVTGTFVVRESFVDISNQIKRILNALEKSTA